MPHADIEDLLATVFLEAWRQRARLEIRDSRGILPWLYTVSRNVAASHLEQRRRENAHARVNATAETMSDLAGVIADDAEREWRIDLARRALASLSEADQEIVDLCVTDGLTPAEAASALEISPVAARSRLHRARIRLTTAFTTLARTPEETHAPD